MNKFLSHIRRFLVEAFSKKQTAFAISFDTTTLSNIINIDPQLDGNSHKEADTLLILHALDVAKQNPFRQLKVVSPDTDVFLLLLHYFPNMPVITSFVTGRGSKKRSIDVGMAYEALGADRSSALLGFHAFTGCDQTSRFCGKSKLTCWKVFKTANMNIVEAFQRIGNCEKDSVDSVQDGLTQFVVNTYCNQLQKDGITLAETRWHLYSKFQDSDKLPMTAAALKHKILRTMEVFSCPEANIT